MTDSLEASRLKILALYPGLRPLAFRILQDIQRSASRPMRVTDSMRNLDQQIHLYQQGRHLIDGKWQVKNLALIVTNSKPGLSFHNYGLSFDCCFTGEDPYLEKLSPEDHLSLWNTYGAVVKMHGMKWGGDFRLINGVRDLPHAELSYGLSITDCLTLYEQGGLNHLWSYLDTIRGVPVGQDWFLS